MTIYDTLARLVQAFKDVKAALISKGAVVTDTDGLEDFPSIISAMPDAGVLTLNTYQAGFGSQKMIIPDAYKTITVNVNVGGEDNDLYHASYAIQGMTADKFMMNMEHGYLGILNYMISNAQVPEIEFNVRSERISSAVFLNNCSTVVFGGTPINFSGIAANIGYMTPFIRCRQLEYVRFVANTIPRSLNFKDCVSLDADSFVSIANGLNANYSYNVQFPTSRQSLVQGTIGNVVDGLFVADPNGSMSLADFITTVKGWAIAWA